MSNHHVTFPMPSSRLSDRTESSLPTSSQGILRNRHQRMSLFQSPTKLHETTTTSDNHNNSLNHMISSAASIKVAHVAYLKSLQEKNNVDFDTDVDYGYGDAAPDTMQPPPLKKRRYERRCSKTPAMLRAMGSPLLKLNIFEDEEEKTKKDNDSWDDGLEIAEELVKHLQLKRRLSK